MTPEVLIVGDPTGRRGFADQVEALGYAVSLCQPRELNRRVRTSNPPAAIVACIGDVDPDVLLAGLRRTRAGASIPVLLFGRLGGNLRDLADVLDIGADHFLEEPISAAELANALGQYAGAPRRDDEPVHGSRGRPSRPTVTEPRAPVGRERESERASEPEAPGSRRLPTEPRPSSRPSRPSTPSSATVRGPVLGDLHRTLDRLEARLRGREDSDPELASLGLESIPDVEPDDGELDDDEPLVTEIGDHLRGRGRESYEPVRGDDMTQPSSSLLAQSRRPGAGELEERSRVRSAERRPAPTPTSTTERLPERGPAARPRATRAEPSRVEPRPESGRGSAVLLGRRPDRPTRGVSTTSRSPEPAEPDDDDEDEEDTGRVQSRAGETATRELRGDRDRDRGPLQVGSALRGREDERERVTVRLEGQPRPLRSEQPPWQEPAPARPSREVESRPRPSAAARPRIDTSLREAGQLGGDTDVPNLLWQLHQQRFTGRLRLHRQRIEKQLWMHEGELVFARSNATSDRLIDGLLRRGVLTRPQYETARRLAAKEPRRAGQLLVDAGFLKPRELEVLLRDHLARVIDSTFAWSEGSFSTEPGERTDEPIQLDLAMPVLLLDGIRHRFEPSELEQALLHAAGRGPLVPRLRESLGRDQAERVAVAAEQLRLLPEEESLLARFDGRHGVAALLAEGADDLGLFALLRVLDLAGLVELAHVGELGLAAHGGDDSRAPAQIDSERILERLRLAREGDYFELLGLARDAARSEIRQAHAELLSTFADDALEAESRSRHARELRELRSAIGEALDILADDAMRSAYLAHLQEPD